MHKIIGVYTKLAANKYFGGKFFKLYIVFVILPLIFTGTLIYFSGIKNIIKLFFDSSTELINTISIISGFLLTSISIIIATSSINDNNFEILRQNFGITLKISKNEKKQSENIQECKQKIKEKIEELRKILLYEIILLFIIIIFFTIFIALLKAFFDGIYTNITLSSRYLGTLSLYLIILCFMFMLNLLRNFLKFQNITYFTIKKDK